MWEAKRARPLDKLGYKENMSSEPVDIVGTVKLAVQSIAACSVVAEHVLERLPHIFNDNWALCRQWRAELAPRLGVDPCDVVIIGSACAGVSLSPYKNFSQFDKESDVDVAVISPHHFDIAWRTLRSFRLANAQSHRERQAIVDHQKKYIYWGCIATDRILRLMPFAKDWTIAASHMQGIAPTEGRAINFRMYRDFDSLRSYQMRGMETLRAGLLDT